VELHGITDQIINFFAVFADIAGFTAWSSVREPALVFTLLEGLYGTFDEIASKLSPRGFYFFFFSTISQMFTFLQIDVEVCQSVKNKAIEPSWVDCPWRCVDSFKVYFLTFPSSSSHNSLQGRDNRRFGKQ